MRSSGVQRGPQSCSFIHSFETTFPVSNPGHRVDNQHRAARPQSTQPQEHPLWVYTLWPSLWVCTRLCAGGWVRGCGGVRAIATALPNTCRPLPRAFLTPTESLGRGRAQRWCVPFDGRRGCSRGVRGPAPMPHAPRVDVLQRTTRGLSGHGRPRHATRPQSTRRRRTLPAPSKVCGRACGRGGARGRRPCVPGSDAEWVCG